MKPSTASRSISFLGVFLILVSLLFMSLAISRSTVRSRADDNNPNNFYLWKTGAGITYNFRYDPHAADVWRFHAVGELKVLARSGLEKTNATP